MINKVLVLLACISVVSLSGGGIDADIAKIKSAPPKQRVKLMNALKKRLAKMNLQERRVAISRLKRSMHAKGAGYSVNRRMIAQERQFRGGNRNYGKNGMNPKRQRIRLAQRSNYILFR